MARVKCPEVAPLSGGNLDDDPEHIPTEFEENDDETYVARGVGGRSIQDMQEMQMNPEEKIRGDFEVQLRGYSDHRLRRLHRKLSTSNRHGGHRNRIRRRKGACIIYMPTRTETENLSAHFHRCGIKSMAYHLQLPKVHLKEVHELFHADRLQVVIATIVFGMGIHKPSISHISSIMVGHRVWRITIRKQEELAEMGFFFYHTVTLPTLLASCGDRNEAIFARKMLA